MTPKEYDPGWGYRPNQDFDYKNIRYEDLTFKKKKVVPIEQRQ